MDGSITRGDLLLAAATVVAPIMGTLVFLHLQNVKKFNDFFGIMKQFPLHRHVGRAILYPRGLAPEDIKEAESGKRP